MNGIIIIDGLDGSGKETLAKEVVKLLNEDWIQNICSLEISKNKVDIKS